MSLNTRIEDSLMRLGGSDALDTLSDEISLTDKLNLIATQVFLKIKEISDRETPEAPATASEMLTFAHVHKVISQKLDFAIRIREILNTIPEDRLTIDALYELDLPTKTDIIANHVFKMLAAADPSRYGTTLPDSMIDQIYVAVGKKVRSQYEMKELLDIAFQKFRDPSVSAEDAAGRFLERTAVDSRLQYTPTTNVVDAFRSAAQARRDQIQMSRALDILRQVNPDPLLERAYHISCAKKDPRILCCRNKIEVWAALQQHYPTLADPHFFRRETPETARLRFFEIVKDHETWSEDIVDSLPEQDQITLKSAFIAFDMATLPEEEFARTFALYNRLPRRHSFETKKAEVIKAYAKYQEIWKHLDLHSMARVVQALESIDTWEACSKIFDFSSEPLSDDARTFLILGSFMESIQNQRDWDPRIANFCPPMIARMSRETLQKWKCFASIAAESILERSLEDWQTPFPTPVHPVITEQLSTTIETHLPDRTEPVILTKQFSKDILRYDGVDLIVNPRAAPAFIFPGEYGSTSAAQASLFSSLEDVAEGDKGWLLILQEKASQTLKNMATNEWLSHELSARTGLTPKVLISLLMTRPDTIAMAISRVDEHTDLVEYDFHLRIDNLHYATTPDFFPSTYTAHKDRYFRIRCETHRNPSTGELTVQQFTYIPLPPEGPLAPGEEHPMKFRTLSQIYDATPVKKITQPTTESGTPSPTTAPPAGAGTGTPSSVSRTPSPPSL